MGLLTPISGRFIDVIELNSQIFGNYSALSINTSYNFNSLTYETLNWSQYHSLVQKVSLHLVSSLPIEITPSSRVVIGILSDSSLEYIFYQLAFMTLNIVPLHLSTRINDTSKVALLSSANACGLICSEELFQVGIKVQSEMSYPIEVLKLNKLNLASILRSPFTLEDRNLLQTFANLRGQGDELAYYVHSTGSTSVHPKLIPLTNSVLLAQTARALNSEPSYPMLHSCLPLLPLFHTGGQMFQLCRPIRWAQHTIVAPNFTGSVMTGAVVLEMINSIQFDYVVWLPKLLIELIDYCDSLPYQEGWKILKNWCGLSQVGGAPLPFEYYQKLLEQGLKVQNIFGSSEVGIFGYGNIAHNFKDEQVLYISKELKHYWSSNVIEGDTESEELFELVIKREELGLFDRGSDYHTKDLFRIIEYFPSLACQFLNRSDDVLVHVTGEKTNPLPMELKLNECLYASRSVILGKNHTLNHCVIQLNWPEINKIGLNQAKLEILNHLKLVNDTCPSHSRLIPSCVHFLSENDEVVTSVKGNVMRELNFKKFSHLINNELDVELPPSPSSSISDKSAIDQIQEIVTNALNLPDLIALDADFFQFGLDSLSALIILKKLKVIFSGSKLTVNQIYKLNNVRELANHLDNGDNEGNIESVENIQSRVNLLVEKYTAKLDCYGTVNCYKNSTERVVLVVGSNGSLACHYIYSLLNRPDVAKVIGLIRGKSAEDKTSYQISIMEGKGLHINPNALKKLQCYSADMLAHKFNLSYQSIQDLIHSVTEVIQIGWRMNFLNSLENFEDCIQTTTNLIEFCLINPDKPKLFQFVSTIAPTLSTYKMEYNGSIPETLTSGKITNLKGCTGYGLSKLVSEQICYQIAKTKNLPVKVYRVGELSGDLRFGQWNTKEFLPLLIRQIIKLGIYPDLSSKSISWVPIDLAANSLSELGTHKALDAELYTVVNPKESKWDVIIHTIQTKLGLRLEKTALDKFLELLNSSSGNSRELDISEGLIDFLRDYLQADSNDICVSWDTRKTCKLSESLNSCPVIDNELIGKYFDYWLSISYLN
ncbi:acetyl-CoA synthetase-like protein [Conidiobolus coronatus NRRL 28638]|uniref:Acetyl-CoA synthetase-like protein n=1 Tax=Conidiobolus coronatus (strain ATCC 28846 / CBS 209.66 / NRRL 28638) TaxID=796925 RepID=A0A137PFD2_CONC2|nr:acetyl-CoA synthetase-like protein [Conidiobolus coronatus NRRL 28638]|eukprot:KXN73641.1 acetyl-CoA synthetase-like protein [Conidiobolus coronatus NRRL 28638]